MSGFGLLPLPFTLFFKSATRPIRSRLFRDLVLIILFTAGLLALVAWGLIGRLNQDLARTRVSDATRIAREEVRNFVQPLSRQLLIARDGLALSGVEALSTERLTHRFLPILRHLDQMAGAILADQDGGEYFLRREGEQWLVRERDPGQPGRLTFTRLDAAGSPLETWTNEVREGRPEDDPRQRPWYLAAQEAQGEVGWSDPYRFQSLDLPGVTAALAWGMEGKTRVLAFDLLLDDLLTFLGRLPLGPEGRAFLLEADGGVYLPEGDSAATGATGGIGDARDQGNQGKEDYLGHQGNQGIQGIQGNHENQGNRRDQGYQRDQGDQGNQGDQREPFFFAHQRFGGPLVFEAAAAWRAAGQPKDQPLLFTSDGRAWVAAFLPLTSNPQGGWIGVALPQSWLVDDLASRWPLLALVTLLITGLAIGLAVLVIRKYGRQLKDLPRLTIDRAHPEPDLFDLIGRGEDAHLEFKSTMRQNLHTGKPGKEIELAWLKGVAAFLNTDGGILLLGVADDGSLLGLEADGFENDDKCRLHFKNLINQHLGPEYARWVRFDLYELEGQRIGAVECERSPTPVFLRARNNEEVFLIRTGPANIELSLSRAMKYLQERF